MSKTDLHHSQKRPHGGNNGSQERCLHPFRNGFYCGDSSIQADYNIVEADLSDGRLGGHFRDPRTTLRLITGPMGGSANEFDFHLMKVI
jgi:hypothetical protein